MGMPIMPYGISYIAEGRLGSRGMGTRLLRPAWPCVMSATSQRPFAMAFAAWPTWTTNDAPPTVVVSV